MATQLSSANKSWQRQRGNRLIGKVCLGVIFFVVTAMNGAASSVAPFFGSAAPLYKGALFIAIFWDALLLYAIWMRHIWARFALAAFLFGFDAALIILLPEQLTRHPALRGEGLQVLSLLAATNALAAAFLIYSIDIRWVTRPTDAGDD